MKNFSLLTGCGVLRLRDALRIYGVLITMIITYQDINASYLPLIDSIPPTDSTLYLKVANIEKSLLQISGNLNKLESANDVEKERKIRIGLSLGYRWLTDVSSAQYTFASISPIDSTLRITPMERTSYLFSTSIIFNFQSNKNRLEEPEITVLEKRPVQRLINSGSKRSSVKGRGNIRPFLKRTASRLCLVSNINILDFSSGQKELAFNKSIEGGLGIGYRINDSMYLGLNWEHVQSWQLYSDIKSKAGEKISLNGVPLTDSNQLDLDDEDLFYKKNLSGWSFKMILCI